MRTALLGAVVALLGGSACLNGDISGTGDDDASGSDSGSMARIDASVDKTSVTTELTKTETITVTLKSMYGFTGGVTISALLVDGANNPVPGVTVTGPSSLALSANSTETAPYQIQVPLKATGSEILATLKVVVTSNAGTKNLSAAVDIKNWFTLDYQLGTGADPNDHAVAGETIQVKRGTILRFVNHDTINHAIDAASADGLLNVAAEPTPGGTPGRTYEINTSQFAIGLTGTVGCRDHGAASDYTLTLL